MLHKHLEHPTPQPDYCLQTSPLHSTPYKPHILAAILSTRLHLDHQLILWLQTSWPTDHEGAGQWHRLRRLSHLYRPPTGLHLLTSALHHSHCWLQVHKPDCHLVKYVDDTVLMSLFLPPSHHHSSVLHEFVEWCDKSALELNTEKTKEMVVTFSSKQRELAAAVISTIHRRNGELVEEYKYLGTIFDSMPKFASNTEEIFRRCQQRQYLLRKLST